MNKNILLYFLLGIFLFPVTISCSFSSQESLAKNEPKPEELRYLEWVKMIPPELGESEYVAVVVLSEQRSYIFHKRKFVKKYVVATGSKTRYKSDRRLRRGIWRLRGRLEKGLKPLYGPRLIYMQYYHPKKKIFIKTQKAYHGTDEPEILGTPRSRGCVYHSNRDILEVYDLIPDDTLVIVTDK